VPRLEVNLIIILLDNMTLDRRATIQEMLLGVDLCLVLRALHQTAGRQICGPTILAASCDCYHDRYVSVSFLVLARRLFVNRKSLNLPDYVFAFQVSDFI
jgi:hypothetical protein